MEITASAYLVQGFYFQPGQVLGVELRPIDGVVGVLNPAMFRNMFAGMIWRDGFLGEWRGHMHDPAGYSDLTAIRLNPSGFRFTKKYMDADYTIDYELELADDGLWTGRYLSDLVGNGYANCIVTPVPERMSEPTRI